MYGVCMHLYMPQNRIVFNRRVDKIYELMSFYIASKCQNKTMPKSPRVFMLTSLQSWNCNGSLPRATPCRPRHTGTWGMQWIAQWKLTVSPALPMVTLVTCPWSCLLWSQKVILKVVDKRCKLHASHVCFFRRFGTSSTILFPRYQSDTIGRLSTLWVAVPL